MMGDKLAALLALVILAGPATGQELSSSILRPTPVDPAAGVISGKLPGAGGARTYYGSVELKAGPLITQLELTGRPNAERRLTLQLLDASAAVADSAFVRAGFGAKDEATKTFAIDASGRYVVRLIVEGDETGRFCVLMGGPALPTAQPGSCASIPTTTGAPPAPQDGVRSGATETAPATAGEPTRTPPTAAETAPAAPVEALSTSIMRPTRIEPTSGLIAGKLPGGEVANSYYLSADLTAGKLLTQLEISGRSNAHRRLTLELLDSEARVADSTFVRSGFATKDEVTRAFAIDVSGRYVIRLIVEGDETGSFCVRMGGTALPNGKPPRCPSSAPSAAAGLSTSIFEPSPIASGIVAGKLPGGEAVQFYYLSGELIAGKLATQLQIFGRNNGSRRLTWSSSMPTLGSKIQCSSDRASARKTRRPRALRSMLPDRTSCG